MIITPIKTHKITQSDTDIFKILDKYVLPLNENSILAITSKIIAITQGRIVKIGCVDKDELIEKESQYYLPREENPYHVSLTITNNILVATAGIDESNGNGFYVLWPENPQHVANEIRKYVKEKFSMQNVGVIITDSKTSPLRWGVTAVAIAYSGFLPLKSYINKPDIFGQKLEYTKMSIIDSLASASALVMGEGDEQTPMAVISGLPSIEFQHKDPSEKELKELCIPIKSDLYSPLLKSVRWKKGKK